MKLADWLWSGSLLLLGAAIMWWGSTRWSAYMAGMLMWHACCLYLVRTYYVYRGKSYRWKK